MRKKTVDVLNDADRLSGILNWQLFKAEQEMVLWGGEPGWRPGDNIYKYPKRTSASSLILYENGNWPRYMVEEMWIADWDDVENFFDDDQIELDIVLFCGFCFVFWVSWFGGENDKCWICDAEGEFCFRYEEDFSVITDEVAQNVQDIDQEYLSRRREVTNDAR